jgi:hypothetical protein
MPSVLSTATRVLRLTLVHAPPSPPAHEDLPPLSDFVAYASECMLAGLLRLDADRLTDLLNAADELELLDVIAIGFDGAIVESDRVVVPRRELLAVKAGDPRGRPNLRLRTRQVAVAASAGPYVMHGYVHGRPGADPMTHIGRRPPMIPLTDATIAYDTAERRRHDEASTLIVNRDTADQIRLAKEDELPRMIRQRGAA